MAQIIEFRRKEKIFSNAERYKALAKSKIRVFNCDNCGEEFEVINDVYPDKCPGCGLRFTMFNHSEENV